MRISLPNALACVSALTAATTALAHFDVGLSSASYLGQGPESRQRNYSSFMTNIDGLSEGPALVTRGHVQGLMSFNDTDYRFIEAPELYVGNSPNALAWSKSDHVQITAGRKLEPWSQLDSHWGLGAWQPRFRWDYLRPQQVGLVGLQSKVKTGPVTTTLLYSPVFVPDRGAPIDFADGRIRSISPWALNPPYIATFRGKDTQIQYHAEIPEVTEIIQHSAVSGMVSIGERTGPWGSAAVAYKPMNQLPMAYDPLIKVGGGTRANPAFADVSIYPRVTYHTVYSMDAGWRNRQWDLWGSLLVDVPKDDYVFVAERVNQNVSRMALFSPTASYQFSGRGPHFGSVSVSYLKRFGQDLPDTGIDSTGNPVADSTSTFDSRYPYEDAILLGLRSPTWRSLTADGKLLVDLTHPGTIVSWNVSYQPRPQWTMYLAADILTSLSEDSPEVGTDFIFRYRANDRFMGGVTYAF